MSCILERFLAVDLVEEGVRLEARRLEMKLEQGTGVWGAEAMGVGRDPVNADLWHLDWSGPALGVSRSWGNLGLGRDQRLRFP